MQLIIFKDYSPELFDIITYPDGQRTIKLHLDKLNNKEPVCIKCRIKNFADLEIFLCLISALTKNDFFIENITYIYLFGMRSDRAFSPREPNYFRDVIAEMLTNINRNGSGETYVFAPHNDIVRSYLYAELWKPLSFSLNSSELNECYFIYGDRSADYLAQTVWLNELSLMVGAFSKKRTDGRIHSICLDDDMQRTIKRLRPERPIVILDDLCDGGATFIAEAQYLRDIGIKNPLYLFVAHGLFTKGVEPLLEHFDRIICTNSYQDIVHPQVTQIQVI